MKKMHFLTVVWGMVVVCLFILLTVFGFTYKNKTKVYKELEEKLVDSTKRYMDEKFLYPDSGEEVRTSADVLIENGYLDSLSVNDSSCTGYTIVSFKSNVFEYKGYVSCDAYKTRGYKE